MCFYGFLWVLFGYLWLLMVCYFLCVLLQVFMDGFL